MSRAKEVLALAEEVLDEVRPQRKISYRARRVGGKRVTGKRHRRVSCPKGYRLVRPRGSPPGSLTGKCVRQGAVERRKRSFSAKRRARRMKGRQAVAKRHRARTMRRRRAAGL